MAQQDVVDWLLDKRRGRPAAFFTVSEVSSGCGMDSGNCSKAISQLVKHGIVEVADLPAHRKQVYRLGSAAYERLTGEPLAKPEVVLR